MQHTTDVVIVGNGVLALMAARALMARDPALTVTVVGPAARPGGASVAAGAMIGSIGEVTTRTFASPGSRAKFELGERALRRWPALLDDLGLAPSARGTHVVANSSSGALDDQNLAALIDAAAASDGAFEEIDPRSIPGLEPAPTQRPMRAFHLPDEFGIDARSVLVSLEDDARRMGVRFEDTLVAALDASGGVVTGVSTAAGDCIAAGAVLVAAGAFSQPLIEAATPLGSTVPIVAGVGVAFTARRVLGAPFETVVRTVNRAGSCGLHVVPLGGDLEYFGATNVVFRSPEVGAGVGMSNFLTECAIGQLDRNVFFHRIESWHIGNRPMALDALPLLGAGPISGMYIAAGTYRDGFHCSPEIAEGVAELIIDGDSTRLQGFSPTRRPSLPSDIEESIDAFVHEAVSGAFEFGLTVPGSLPGDVLASWFRSRAQEVFDALDLDAGLPPDTLHYLALNRRSDDDLVWAARALRQAD